MNLVIDQGNTNLKIYFIEQNKIIKKLVYPLEETKIFLDDDYQKCIYCSVSGHHSILEQLKNPLIFDINTPIPIKNLYKSPTLGLDRLAAAVGANYFFKKQNVLIIDIGTAITYDFLTENEEFYGGNISPGINLRYKALNFFTKKLPLVEHKSFNDDVFAQNTVDAIKNGVMYGILYEIQTYCSAFLNNYPNSQIVLTGGDVNLFAEKLNFNKFVCTDLVAFGLNYVLNYNILNIDK